MKLTNFRKRIAWIIRDAEGGGQQVEERSD
jgi:hypothetical protein